MLVSSVLVQGEAGEPFSGSGGGIAYNYVHIFITYPLFFLIVLP